MPYWMQTMCQTIKQNTHDINNDYRISHHSVPLPVECVFNNEKFITKNSFLQNFSKNYDVNKITLWKIIFTIFKKYSL